KAKPKAVALPVAAPAGAAGPGGQVSPDEPVPAVAIAKEIAEGSPPLAPMQPSHGPSIKDLDGPTHEEVTERSAKKLRHGSVVIAAITSCTNTSNPSVMIAAGLLAKKAVERGLHSKPHVKTSLAPGSKVVTEYLQEAGLLEPLEQLRFHVVGYGCTTCIAAGTPVLLANGTSRPIEQLPSAGGAVLLGPTADGRLGLAAQAEVMNQGVRDC